MIKYILVFILTAFFSSACDRNNTVVTDHEHEEVKLQFTSYNSSFELFAEADPFVAGQQSNVLSHFSHLPDFKALERGTVTLRIVTGDKEVSQTLDKPSRKGIYSFDIRPKSTGEAELIFEIEHEGKTSEMRIPNQVVYDSQHEALHSEQADEVSRTNSLVFTKEQSWKVDFATDFPRFESFGQIIKTSAQVQPAQGDEVQVTASITGVVKYSGSNLTEGQSVSSGQTLLSVSGSTLAENNSIVRFNEAKSNFENAKAEYERQAELAKDKIVSERELQSSRTRYENTKTLYDNLSENFNSSGQTIKSPMNGFIRNIFVSNGEYVEAGQPVLAISQNKNLLIRAEVRQKYAPYLASIKTAVLKSQNSNNNFTLEELNGKILSIGKSVGSENFLIPVSLQIENNGAFMPGEFIELYLKTEGNAKVITIPNEAILEDQGVYYVFVQINPELFEKRQVQPGATDGIRTEVTSGLSEKERIITQGAIHVKLSQSSGTLDPHAGHVH